MPELAVDEQSKPADDAETAEDMHQSAVVKPGGFKNDPEDPTNPNEAIERERRQVRP